MDSNEYEKDTRFASQVVEHHAKQRFESNNTQQRSKLRKISSSQLIKNRQAIKADINRKGLLLANQKIANQRSRNHIKTTRLADLADYCKFGKCLDRSITSRIIFWVVRRHWTNSKYKNGNPKTSRIWELYQSRDRCSRIWLVFNSKAFKYSSRFKSTWVLRYSAYELKVIFSFVPAELYYREIKRLPLCRYSTRLHWYLWH